jgi:tetratricopeptide (TPR) repeat protein
VPGVVSNASSGGTTALYAAPDGSLRATLGVLAPGDSLGTRITFAQWLPRVGPTRRYALPLGAPQDPGMIGEFSFDMDVSGEPLTALRLPAGARLQNGHVRLQHADWRPRGALAVDLVDDAAPPAARAWIPSYTPRGDRRVMRVEVALPATPAAGTDFAVVLDDSAATGAGSLDIARAAVDALLRQLGAQDRVALLFGDLGARPAEGDLGRLGAVTAARRERVLDAVSRARPGGASDLGRMLTDAHAALDPRRNGVVIYLGDGSPTVGLIDPTRLAESLRRACPDLRLLGLAIGQGAHDEVLRALAGAGGEVRRAEDPPEAVARMSAMAARATRPLLRDVRVSLGARAQQVVPEVVDALPAGDAVRVYTLLDEGEAPPKTVRVDVREGGASRTLTLPLRVASLRDDGDVSRRMATARIAALEAAGAARAAVADIGARYGLITPASALLVGVDPISPAVGWTVSASPWALDDGARALPSLGVGALGPRGVTTLVSRRELAVAVDDGDGWHPHRTDEGGGADPSGTLAAALAGAEPVARACVARKRALRPGLAGAVTIGATVDATGRVTAADIADSTLRDAETESCIRRAVQGLTLPPPALLGASPARVTRRFEFPGGAEGSGPGAVECPSSARLSRAMRRVLWRERLNLRGVTAEGALGVWGDAARRCELRWWEDRVALLDLFLDALADPTTLARVRDGLDDASAADWLDAAIARQFGASRAWRALHRAAYVDWGALLRQLAAPALTPEARVTLLRAWLAVAPRDLDLRLRLLDALEAAGREREARSVADALRRDPIADARVRGRVGEFLLRLGDRAEALRALSEIVEFAPYDPWARARLGDLLVTSAEPALAHRQFQTLALLDNADPLADARLGLAALGAGREDEGLRALRRAVEAAGEGDAGRDLLALFSTEVARVAAARRDDPGARAWSRVGRQLGPRHRPQLVLRWTHPDVGMELLVQRPEESAPTAVGSAASTLGLRAVALDESDRELRVVVRAATGLRTAREARCTLAVLLDGRLTERSVTLRPNAPSVAFTLRAGELSPAATLPTDGTSALLDD